MGCSRLPGCCIALAAGIGACVLLLVGRRGDKWGHYLGVAVPIVCFVYGLVALLRVYGLRPTSAAVDSNLFNWIPVGSFQVNFGAAARPAVAVLRPADHRRRLADPHLLDRLHGARPRRRRFFAYFNLFVAAMLLLVLGNTFLSLYVGWEGVGLASYLLIGFWSFKPAAATAAKKAFIMNRVGDVGLSLAIMLMFATLGTHVASPGSSAAAATLSGGAAIRRWRCCCCSAPAASPASSRCRAGCPTPWRARPRSRR